MKNPKQERMYSYKEVSALIEMLEKCKDYFLIKNTEKSDKRADGIAQLIEEFKKLKQK